MKVLFGSTSYCIELYFVESNRVQSHHIAIEMNRFATAVTSYVSLIIVSLAVHWDVHLIGLGLYSAPAGVKVECTTELTLYREWVNILHVPLSPGAVGSWLLQALLITRALVDVVYNTVTQLAHQLQAKQHISMAYFIYYTNTVI